MEVLFGNSDYNVKIINSLYGGLLVCATDKTTKNEFIFKVRARTRINALIKAFNMYSLEGLLKYRQPGGNS